MAVASMIDPVALRPAVPLVQSQTDAPGAIQAAAPGNTHRPSAADAQDFARAVAMPADVPTEVQATTSGGSAGLGARLAQQAEALTARLHLDTAPPLAGPSTTPAADTANTAIGASMAAMEHAYMVAIETTLASRGSTESTKIFNTLLKGQ